MSVAIHTLSFRGLAGAMFCLHCAAWFFFTMAFATPYWGKDNIKGGGVEGIWERGSISQTVPDNRDWYKAVQAMITIGQIGLFICMVLVSLYMCIHKVSKNATIIGLVVTGFLSFVFMVIGIIIYAVESKERLGWSFGFAIIGAGFTLAAAIVSLLQLRASGVSR